MNDMKTGEIIVIGGGISGISAAVELAEMGNKVTIIEREPSLGGRVAKMHQYFPKMCPPYCGLEIYYKRIRTNPNINIMTSAEVGKIDGSAGNFTVNVKISPRYVNGKCTSCNDCVESCPVERPNDLNYGLDKNKAIYLPHELSLPYRYVIDKSVCPGQECAKCVSACKYDAIDLSMEPSQVELSADAVIVTTGWKPYDANNIDNLHFGQFKNVITNVMLERLASSNGPTEGKILRPSDNKEVQNIAFVQCAGSRDENHLSFCSSVCCTASLKQARYIREAYPEASIYIFYIDLRVKGRNEDFLKKVEDDDKTLLIKGKVADIEENTESKNLTVVAEDIYSGKKYRPEVDMVVLATGMNPSMAGEKIPFNSKQDEFGFFMGDNGASDTGIYFAGTCKNPADVSSCIKDANNVAIKAMQSIERK